MDQHQNRKPLLLLIPCRVFQETRHVSHSRVWWIPYWIVGCPHRQEEQTQVPEVAVSKRSQAEQDQT